MAKDQEGVTPLRAIMDEQLGLVDRMLQAPAPSHPSHRCGRSCQHRDIARDEPRAACSRGTSRLQCRCAFAHRGPRRSDGRRQDPAALALAERAGGEVVSADSQQVYIGMDIGTGKVSADERARVPHHVLDVVSPTRR